MVALKQMFDDPNVSFVSARNLLLQGVTYAPGDEVPSDVVKGLRNRESLMRSHRVIAVTDDLNNVPRAYRKEFKDRQLTFRKLNRTDAADFNTTGKTIPVIQAALNERLVVGTWADALLSEVKGANRVTLVDWIKAGPSGADFDGTDIETYVNDSGNYASGEPLDEYTHPTDAALAYPV